ncbi:MAG: aspartate dehydrogenase [Candidatus Methanomethylophilaceae archaeon]|nr:aspartate dehydrogenase [Candidatus Methanomethylophilaceae archaeon]
MRITIIGCGFIGSYLARTADSMSEVKRIYLYDTDRQAAERVASTTKKGIVTESVEEELYHCDLVIEAASQAAAKHFAPIVVERGVSMMLMSVGALVDDDFRNSVFQKASKTESCIYIPSGAVCGVDGLRAARESDVEYVELITTKAPKSLEDIPYVLDKGIVVDDLKERTVIYTGTAREAVKLFPKNINVAATVSLFGIGFDKTKVTIVADPDTTSNSHELRYRGVFGEIVCHTYNVPSPENPRTSHLAALSAAHALRSLVKNVWIAL